MGDLCPYYTGGHDYEFGVCMCGARRAPRAPSRPPVVVVPRDLAERMARFVDNIGEARELVGGVVAYEARLILDELRKLGVVG